MSAHGSRGDPFASLPPCSHGWHSEAASFASLLLHRLRALSSSRAPPREAARARAHARIRNFRFVQPWSRAHPSFLLVGPLAHTTRRDGSSSSSSSTRGATSLSPSPSSSSLSLLFSLLFTRPLPLFSLSPNTSPHSRCLSLSLSCHPLHSLKSRSLSIARSSLSPSSSLFHLFTLFTLYSLHLLLAAAPRHAFPPKCPAPQRPGQDAPPQVFSG